jgi:hypothetical protein
MKIRIKCMVEYLLTTTRCASSRWFPFSRAEALIEMQISRYLWSDDFDQQVNDIEFDEYLIKVWAGMWCIVVLVTTVYIQYIRNTLYTVDEYEIHSWTCQHRGLQLGRSHDHCVR